MSHLVTHMSPGFRALSSDQTLAGKVRREGTRLESSEDDDDDSDGSYSGNTSSTSRDLEQDSDDSSEELDHLPQKRDLISLSDDDDQGLEPGDGARNEKSHDDLESWLGAPESSSAVAPELQSFKAPEFEPRRVLALDFTKGDGVEVQYSFTRSSELSSPSMVSLRLFFHNKSSELISGISIGDEASSEHQSGFECGNSLVMPPENVLSLEPGEKAECNFEIDFRHNLISIRIWLHFNSKKFPIKITPEPGVLLRPHQMTLDGFRAAEAQISGMHRSSRRIRMRNRSSEEARLLCKGIISAANVALTGVLLEEMVLFFSGETLAGSMICLISVCQEENSSHGTLKVSCEDTLFGLALLNHLDKSLAALES